MNCNCLVLLVVLQVVELPMTQVNGRLVVPLTSIPSEKTCSGKVRETLRNFKSNLNDILRELIDIYTVPDCGDGLWYRVAHLNMTDPSQQCPPAWREYNTSGVRACGRPASNGGSRPATLYPTDHQYSRVCGRAIGFQVGNPDAFIQLRSLDQGYMDGISITHGQPRHHIWSYVASLSENSTEHPQGNCPCSLQPGVSPPSILLGIITTVNQQILKHLSHHYSTQMTDSGMVSSVKVPAAVVPCLPHGSVYGYSATQLMRLR